MYKTRANKLKSIIQADDLKPLIDQVEILENANKRLKKFLPTPLSENVIVSNIKGKTLILQTNSSAWSTRTNFLATEVINYMRNEGGLAMVERLKVKVIPPKAEPKIPKRSVMALSCKTSELLKSVASSIENRDLSEVLQRLSEHYKKEKDPE